MPEHKWYRATVEFDESVDLLHGEVANSGSYLIATCEATDVAGLRREFRRSAHEYLGCCEERGAEPRRLADPIPDPENAGMIVVLRSEAETSGEILTMQQFRFELSLLQRMQSVANQRGLSVRTWIEQAVENAMSERQRRMRNLCNWRNRGARIPPVGLLDQAPRIVVRPVPPL